MRTTTLGGRFREMRLCGIDDCGSRRRILVIEGGRGGLTREVLDVDGTAALEEYDRVWGKYRAVFFVCE